MLKSFSTEKGRQICLSSTVKYKQEMLKSFAYTNMSFFPLLYSRYSPLITDIFCIIALRFFCVITGLSCLQKMFHNSNTFTHAFYSVFFIEEKTCNWSAAGKDDV